MRIKKMTATFGALENAVLEPDSGLTVITASDKAGRSTWVGFLKAMLYGIDTCERDKTGCQPWSGAPMSGEMQVEWQGKDVTIRRFPARTGPFGGFEAVYTATGDPVPDLTAANVGERLTGVGREVYLRSAFVGQGGAAIGAGKEMEARVSALVGTLREMDQTRRRRAEAEQELTRLEERQKELQSDLEIWDRLERHDLNRRYAEAYMEWEEAEAAIPEVGDLPSQAAEYREMLAKVQQARAAADAARRRVDDLAAQGGRLFDTLELLHPPAQSKAATAAQLSANQRELARVRDELARTEGILAHMGGPEDAEARRNELDARLTRRLGECDALTTALEALSTGTAEQLYLAVRLALCALTVPDAPMVLDDALTAFDDARCALALELLRAQSAERQILLFSCHSREAQWAKAHNVSVLTL